MQHAHDKASTWQSLIRALERNNLHLLWKPKTVQIELTNLCNSRCKMCVRWKWVEESKNVEGKLNYENLVPIFDQLNDAGTENILFSGGEPLLFTDFLNVVRYLKFKGIRIAIFTNGTCMTKNIAEELILSDAHVCFSLDASTSETNDMIRGVKGSFSKTTGNIRTLTRLRRSNKGSSASIGMNFVVQKDNSYDIASFVKLGDKIGVDYVRFGLVHGFPELSLSDGQIKKVRRLISTIKKSKERRHVRIFLSPYLEKAIDHKISLQDLRNGLPAYSLFREYPTTCFKVFEYCMVDAFADVYPCTYAYFDNKQYGEYFGLRKKFCMGNLLKDRFVGIWNGKKYNKFRKEVNPVRIERLKNVCGQCDHYYAFEEATKWLTLAKTKDGIQISPPDVVHTYEFENFVR